MNNKQPATYAAFIQAILDTEGLTLDEQKEALQAALSGVIRKQSEAAHNKKV